MKEHESCFDEKLSKLARNEACGLPKDAGIKKSKIVNGKVGRGKLELSDHLKELINTKWKTVLERETGCATYEELRKSFQQS